MPRGFLWALYFDDSGVAWALRVDADHAQDPIRGWTVVDDPSIAPLPRGWLPRQVNGLDENGHPRSCRVGTTDCALWVGDVGVFTVEGTDQSSHEVTVIGRQQENTRARPEVT